MAILGRTEEAVRITNTILPPNLAAQVAPYMRYMPQLTPAQQAAAVNLGAFPRASEIGRDDPRIAAYSRTLASRPQVASADAALIPKGEPLGAKAAQPRKETRQEAAERHKREKAREKEERRKARAAAAKAAKAERVAPPVPVPVRQAPGQAPQVASAEPAPTPKQVSAQLAQATSPKPATTPGPAKQDRLPGFDLARLPALMDGGAAQPTGSGNVEAPPPVEERPSLTDAFSDLGTPKAAARPAPGAVDITRITPAAPKPKVVEKAEEPARKVAPPSHPSRIWVQLGIGRNKKALAFDWKRIVRKAPELLKGREASVSEMGQTNRMLTGPFESARAANSFVADLRKAEVEGPYVWTSPAGQVVDALPGT
jgi:hypothetical protein